MRRITQKKTKKPPFRKKIRCKVRRKIVKREINQPKLTFFRKQRRKKMRIRKFASFLEQRGTECNFLKDKSPPSEREKIYVKIDQPSKKNNRPKEHIKGMAALNAISQTLKINQRSFTAKKRN